MKTTHAAAIVAALDELTPLYRDREEAFTAYRAAVDERAAHPLTDAAGRYVQDVGLTIARQTYTAAAASFAAALARVAAQVAEAIGDRADMYPSLQAGLQRRRESARPTP